MSAARRSRHRCGKGSGILSSERRSRANAFSSGVWCGTRQRRWLYFIRFLQGRPSVRARRVAAFVLRYPSQQRAGCSPLGLSYGFLRLLRRRPLRRQISSRSTPASSAARARSVRTAAAATARPSLRAVKNRLSSARVPCTWAPTKKRFSRSPRTPCCHQRQSVDGDFPTSRASTLIRTGISLTGVWLIPASECIICNGGKYRRRTNTGGKRDFVLHRGDFRSTPRK